MVIVAQACPENRVSEPTADRSGGNVRIERLVRENFSSLWRLARRWGLPSADADDVAQRALVIMSQRLDEIAPGRERAFLFRTVLFLASKVHRSRRRRPEDNGLELDEHVDSGLNPEQQLEQKRARADLDALLGELPEELRAVFVLFELEDLSQVEIAAALEIPQGTVASRLRRARDAFTALMNSQKRAATHNRGAKR